MAIGGRAVTGIAGVLSLHREDVDVTRRVGTIELTSKLGRVKHYLLGRPLTGGDSIELHFSGGWVVGRYEWSTDPTEPPYFHYSIELEGDGEVAQGRLAIPDGSLLRWPPRSW